MLFENYMQLADAVILRNCNSPHKRVPGSLFGIMRVISMILLEQKIIFGSNLNGADKSLFCSQMLFEIQIVVTNKPKK